LDYTCGKFGSTGGGLAAGCAASRHAIVIESLVMPDRRRSIADLRAFRRREDRRLVVVIMLFLVIVGGVAIGLVYGWSTAATGAICLVAGAAVFGLLWLLLSLVERWAKRE
jgi:hypothetical protein